MSTIKEFSGGVENLVENIKPVKKLDGALFTFLLLVALMFDVIGLIPFLSTIMLIMFTVLIKAQLWLAGYHSGIIRMVVVFFLNFVVDVLIPIWFACTIFTISFYFFNNVAYKKQQKLLSSIEHKFA